MRASVCRERWGTSHDNPRFICYTYNWLTAAFLIYICPISLNWSQSVSLTYYCTSKYNWLLSLNLYLSLKYCTSRYNWLLSLNLYLSLTVLTNWLTTAISQIDVYLNLYLSICKYLSVCISHLVRVARTMRRLTRQSSFHMSLYNASVGVPRKMRHLLRLYLQLADSRVLSIDICPISLNWSQSVSLTYCTNKYNWLLSLNLYISLTALVNTTGCFLSICISHLQYNWLTAAISQIDVYLNLYLSICISQSVSLTVSHSKSRLNITPKYYNTRLFA